MSRIPPLGYSSNGLHRLLQGEFPVSRYDDSVPAGRRQRRRRRATPPTSPIGVTLTSVQPTPPTRSRISITENAAGGATYHYRVRAINGRWRRRLGRLWRDGCRAEDHCLVLSRGPDAPVLTATATSVKDILLQWNVPASNGTEFEGYELQRWNGVSSWTNLWHQLATCLPMLPMIRT